MEKWRIAKVILHFLFCIYPSILNELSKVPAVVFLYLCSCILIQQPGKITRKRFYNLRRVFIGVIRTF